MENQRKHHRDLVEANKSNPCPHCGKPDWCYTIGELSVCKRDQPPATGWVKTNKADKEGATYYAPVEKSLRPAGTKYFYYNARNGEPMVRVKRIDYGDGRKKDFKQEHLQHPNGKWTPGLGDYSADVPIYRYVDVMAAKFEQRPIFLVEGETCADSLWEIGLAGTTNIGGSSKWGLYEKAIAHDLEGAQTIIVPDRDEPGVAWADKVATTFPDAMWLYPYPEKNWDILPKSQGLDIGDWIADKKLTAEDILAAVGERRSNLKGNIIQHPAIYSNSEPEHLDAEQIIQVADEVRLSGRSPARESIDSINSAKKLGIAFRDFRELIKERQFEDDLDFSLIESKEKFQQLWQLQNTQINLHSIFPQSLAAALLSKAASDRIDPVRILQSLLPVVGTVLGGKIGIELKKGCSSKDSHIEYPIFYTADVGHPSTGKSATQGTLIEPLQEAQEAEQERLEEALLELEQVEEIWRSMPKEERAEKFGSDENPRIFEAKYCKPRKWIFDEASAQALTKRIAEQQPKQGCLLLQDELAGLFDSLDQFTGGKGNQKQFLLKAWNKPLRGGVDRVDLKSASYTFKRQSINLTGTIQPAVARRIFNVATDPDGMLSRFLPAVASIPEDFAQPPTVRVNVYEPIKNLIEKLQNLPECLLTLSGAAADAFWQHWSDLRRGQQSNFDLNPAYSYFLGKQISYTGRFAIAIHCLENLNAPAALPEQVTAETMMKAIRLSHFYCGQFLLLQSKSAEQQPIEGILLDILKFAQQQGGTISTRQLCQSRFKRLEFEGKKFNAYFANKFLTAIADAGYGKFESKIFTAVLPFVATGVTALKASQDMALEPACRQNSKVCISENELRDRSTPKGLTDESVFEILGENPEISKNTHFEDLSTDSAQSLSPQGNTAATKRQQTATNGNTELEEQLLSVANFEEFTDFANWLDDPQFLAELSLKVGGKPQIFWLAQEIAQIIPSGFLPAVENLVAMRAIANLRRRFSREDLQAAGKLACAGDREKNARLRELVQASKVEEADAQIMRDIALVWWEEFYPHQLQSLENQMFARGCPAEKYSVETLAAWLKIQTDDLVRERILMLCRDLKGWNETKS